MNIRAAISFALLSPLLLTSCKHSDNSHEIPAPVDDTPIYSTQYTPLYQRYLEGEALEGDFLLNDWSKVGYGTDNKIPTVTGPVFHVADYGAFPDDGIDDLEGIQATINAAMAAGGGVVQLASGLYELNIDHDDRSFQHSDALWATGPGIVIRGAGSGIDNAAATTIKQWKKVDKGSEADQAVRTDHTINFGSTDNMSSSRANDITQAIAPGETLVHFNVKDPINVGDDVHITMLSWAPPYDANNPDNPNLMLEVLYPLYKDGEDEYDSYNVGFPYAPFRFHAKVIAMHADGIAELDRPVPQAIKLEFFPKFYSIAVKENGTSECGVENLNIESIHDGSYTEGYYDTGGVSFHHVTNCWVKNIAINNTIMDISIHSSLYVTLEDVDIHGEFGHHGIGFYGTSNSYVNNFNYYGSRNHMITFNANASFNVVRNVINHTEDGGAIDFHSGYSKFNLMENIQNTSIASSGAKSNNSSSGQYNLLWNATKKRNNNPKNADGLFQYCWYTSMAYYGEFRYDPEGPHNYCYRRHPRMLYVGLTHVLPDTDVTINKKSDDMIDEWRYIEGINNPNVYPRSIYAAQLEGERTQYPLLKGVANTTVAIDETFDPMHGVIAYNAGDGDLTSKVIITGEVDTSFANQAHLIYQVTDSFGLTTSMNRYVTVK
ncbi:hypothetical protein BCU68_09795 [Vibrio sp. 10N.286.49.B3]|uniref:immunoglobulin-like domain-containing protein n=1 Tax=Vibrio sp. 10N.286.49.B3 TaxID=1880855 RepID=UPI000C8303DE|nr:immunoglobulin-like domain-containing protein [Vibrio sp. 10N.286.49.B3]PMH46067.1 hypothetical protein BCU68_09795 [Vibrio sp. 10N.286.49.B3]